MDNLDDSIYEILSEEYGGKFVATKSFNSVEVIASGESMEEVIKNCNASKYHLLYVPKKGENFYLSQN